MACLVQVFVVQDCRSGSFLRADLEFGRSLSEAGRLEDREEARQTGISQLGYEFEVHELWEMREGSA